MTYMKTGIATVMIILCAATAWSTPDKVRLESWKFIKGDAPVDAPVKDWESVTVPHSWNVADGYDGSPYYRGPGWYQMSLQPDQVSSADRVFLRFQAVGTVADVYVDGTNVARHAGGYTAFSTEITPFIKEGKPLDLRVRANNAYSDKVPPLSGDFTVWGGMHRPAELILKNEVCLSPLDHASSGVYLFQENVSTENADLRVRVLIDNGADAEKEIRTVFSLQDAEGNTVAEQEVTATLKSGIIDIVEPVLTVKEPHLWHGTKDPYLYTLNVELYDGSERVDRYTKKTGFRFVRIDPEKGFYLNGKPYPLRGVNLHYDREGVGPTLTEVHVREDYERVMEVGANTVRLAHYPHGEIAYERCDELGLLVWAEIPLVNEVRMLPDFTSCACGQLRDMIKQLGNHCSIYCWSISNEIRPGRLDNPFSLLEQLNALAKLLDPTRYTTLASNQRHEDRLNRITDIFALNSYPAWYSGGPHDMKGRIAQFNESGGARGVGISEYGAGGAIEHQSQKLEIVAPRGKWHPEQWQAYLHECLYRDILDSPECWGSYIWNMFNFSADNRDEGAHPGINNKGLMTHDHKTRKDAFFFYKANWTETPVLHLTSKRHLIRHEPVTPVKVYSNCETVELWVNGKSAGAVRPDDLKIALWETITLKEGDNEIAVKAARDGKELTDRITWTYDPAAPAPEAAR